MRATIYRPPGAQGSHGELQGEPQVIRRDVPLLELTPLNGNESELANQTSATTAYRVRLYGDPERLISQTDHLVVAGRRLEVAAILDPSLRQVGVVELVCGELARDE